MQQKTSFSELHPLTRPQEVTLGDRHILEATAEGTVMIETLLPDGSTKKCRLQDVLYVPKLSHNLRSVSNASEAGKSTAPGAKSSTRTTVIAFATRVANLYYLEFCRRGQQSNLAEEGNEKLWHRRYGHLGENNLRKLAKRNLVDRFDYNVTVFARNASEVNTIVVVSKPARVRQRSHSSWFILTYAER